MKKKHKKGRYYPDVLDTITLLLWAIAGLALGGLAIIYWFSK